MARLPARWIRLSSSEDGRFFVGNNDMTDKRYLTIEDVAGHFGFNPSTVYRLAQRGELPALKIAGRWRFSRELLDRWVADQVTLKWLRRHDGHRHGQRRAGAP